MNVKQLKEMLDKYPGDMVVVYNQYSDCHIAEEFVFSVINGVYNEGVDYVMYSHHTMSEENKAKEQQFLCIL